MIGVSRMPINKIKLLGWVLYGLTFLGLIATKWSPLGVSMGGVERWLKLGPIPFQVSELGKIALLLVLANYWSKAAKTTHEKSIESTFPWLFSGLILTAPFVLLVLMQPHLSAALVLFSLLLIVTFFAGVPGVQYAKIFGSVVLIVGVIVGLSSAKKMPFLKDYQQARIAHFLSPDKNEQGGYYQTAQGLRAIERGGWIGVGPGNSLYKQGHLPAPHTDFILAVTGEEWGVAGMLFLLSLYALLIFFCLQVGHTASNTFEMLVATGMGILLFVQVFGNMGVVLGILPVTGMPLPFISYGGSGLVCLLMGMGVVLGISRHQD
jgi:cell division protein FtsW (lipid II flippase)